MDFPNYRIGFFGKLPVFADFISYNTADSAIKFLEQWFQEGLYTAKNFFPSWPEEYYKMPRYCFVLQSGNKAKFIVGILGGSEDQSGRKYPFIVFGDITTDSVSQHIAAIPRIFSNFFNTAYNFVLGGWAGFDLNGMIAWANETRIDAEQENLELLFGKCSLFTFFYDIFSSFNNDKKFLIFQNLVEMLSTIKRIDTKRQTIGFRFPLSNTPEKWTLETSFWLSLFFYYAGKMVYEPVIFWNKDITFFEPSLLVYLYPPLPGQLINLIEPGLNNNSVNDLAKDGSDDIEAILNEMNPNLKNWLSDPDMNLNELISKFKNI